MVIGLILVITRSGGGFHLIRDILENYGDWGKTWSDLEIPDFFNNGECGEMYLVNRLKESNIPLNKLWDSWKYTLIGRGNKDSMLTLEKIKTHSLEFVEKGLCAYIYGNTGTGKTSYCIEIMKYYIRDSFIEYRYPFAGMNNVPFIFNTRLFNTFVNDRRSPLNDVQSLIKKMKYSDILVIDDMSFIEANTVAFNRLYEILEYRDSHELSNLFTSNLTPQNLKEVFKGEDAFISRVLGRCREEHIIPLVGIDMRNKK